MKGAKSRVYIIAKITTCRKSYMVRHRNGDNSRICNKCFKNSVLYLLWAGSTVPKLLLKFETGCK